MEKEENTYIRRMFKSYDDNGNGVLDREEFCKVFKSMIKKLATDETEEEIDQITQEAIELFDLNRNGKIEYNEFYQIVKFLIDEKGLSIHDD